MPATDIGAEIRQAIRKSPLPPGFLGDRGSRIQDGGSVRFTPTSSKISISSLRPFAWAAPRPRNWNRELPRSRTGLLTRIVVPNCLFMPSSRDATFTVSPIAVYCRRASAPTLPTTATPVCTPNRVTSSGRPEARLASFSSSIAALSSSAHRHASSTCVASATGAFHIA